MPFYSTFFFIFILASIGLPGTSGFIGEFLILIGAFKYNYLIALFAAIGVILSACYALWMYKRVVFGKISNDKINNLLDLNKREIISIIPLVIIAILLGIYPNIILDTISESSNNIIETFNQKTNLEVVKNE